MNTVEKPKVEWLRLLLFGILAAVLALYLYSCRKYLWETPTNRLLFVPFLLAAGGAFFLWGMQKLEQKNEYLLQGAILLASF